MILSIYFVDQYTGWLVGENGSILKTTDGGDNWKLGSSVIFRASIT